MTMPSKTSALAPEGQLPEKCLIPTCGQITKCLQRNSGHGCFHANRGCTPPLPLPSAGSCLSLLLEFSFYTLHANTPWIQGCSILIQPKPGGEGGKGTFRLFSGSCQLTCEASYLILDSRSKSQSVSQGPEGFLRAFLIFAASPWLPSAQGVQSR